MPLFAASLFLLAALSVAVPLALHLLHRRRPQPYRFSTIRFLQQAIARSRRSRRLTQCVTLLLRIFTLLLLAIAFAQPMIQHGKLFQTGNRTICVVLDGSASMQTHRGDQTLFDIASQWANSFLGTMNTGDRVFVIIAASSDCTETPEPITDVEHVREVLHGMECGTSATDMPSFLLGLLKNGGDVLDGAELHVFSDFQQGSWSQTATSALSRELNDRHCILFCNAVLAGTGGDAGIRTAVFKPSVLGKDGHFASVTELLHSRDFSGNVSLEMTLNGAEQGKRSVQLPGDDLAVEMIGRAVENRDVPANAAGIIRLPEDSYSLNNAYYYSLDWIHDRPSLVVNGTGEERDGYFLKRALKPTDGSPAYVSPQEVSWPVFMNTSDWSKYAMIFICNPPAMNATVLERLRKYVQNGGVVMLFPGSQEGLSQDALQAICGNAFQGNITRKTYSETTMLTATLPPDSKWTAGMRLGQGVQMPWILPVRERLVINGNAVVSFVGEGGTMKEGFVSAIRAGKGEVLVCAVSANRDWSDLPLKPFFFVLMQEISRYGAGYHQTALTTTIGGEIILDCLGESGGAEPPAVICKDENGRQIDLAAAVDERIGRLFLRGFETAGLFTVELPWGQTRQIAVNLPESERDIAAIDAGILEQYLGGDIRFAWSTSQEELLLKQAAYGQRISLTPLFLILAFVFAMLEVLYANWRSRRVDTPNVIKEIIKG